MVRNWLSSIVCAFLAPAAVRRRTAGSRSRGPLRRQHSGIESLEHRIALSTAGAVRPLNYGIDVVPANTNSFEVITVGGSRANAVNFNGDRDWYRVSLVAGRSYRFNLDASVNLPGMPALGDPLLRLRNSSGHELASNDDANGTRNSQIAFRATSSGLHFLDAGAYRSGFGGYTLRATDVTPVDDFTATTATTGNVAVNGSISGVVNFAGDRDWIRVYLVAGRNYRFELDGNSLGDPTLRLRNGSGRELAFNDDASGFGRNSRISYRPSTSGFFFLDAGGYGSGVGSYTLRVRQV